MIQSGQKHFKNLGENAARLVKGGNATLKGTSFNPCQLIIGFPLETTIICIIF